MSNINDEKASSSASPIVSILDIFSKLHFLDPKIRDSILEDIEASMGYAIMKEYIKNPNKNILDLIKYLVKKSYINLNSPEFHQGDDAWDSFYEQTWEFMIFEDLEELLKIQKIDKTILAVITHRSKYNTMMPDDPLRAKIELFEKYTKK